MNEFDDVDDVDVDDNSENWAEDAMLGLWD